MPGVHDLGEGVGARRDRADAAAERVDEQDHQGAPEAVVEGAGDAVRVAGGHGGVHGGGPDPGGRHGGGGHAEADPIAGRHVGVGVLLLLGDGHGHDHGPAVEQRDEQDHPDHAELGQGCCVLGGRHRTSFRTSDCGRPDPPARSGQGTAPQGGRWRTDHVAARGPGRWRASRRVPSPRTASSLLKPSRSLGPGRRCQHRHPGGTSPPGWRDHHMIGAEMAKT